jgi:hypothetical protein
MVSGGSLTVVVVGRISLGDWFLKCDRLGLQERGRCQSPAPNATIGKAGNRAHRALELRHDLLHCLVECIVGFALRPRVSLYRSKFERSGPSQAE